MDLTGVGSIADLLKDGLDRIFPNKNDPAYVQAQAALIQAQTAGTLKGLDDDFQLALEQIKADQGQSFRNGAGWTCVAGFALALFKPIIEWGSVIAGHAITLPPVDTTTATTMLAALLGLGGMHVYQQVKS